MPRSVSVVYFVEASGTTQFQSGDWRKERFYVELQLCEPSLWSRFFVCNRGIYSTAAKMINRARNKPIAPSRLGIDHLHSLDVRSVL